MSQKMLNGLTTLCIEKDMLEKINYEDIIDDFVSQNARRCHFKLFMYKFSLIFLHMQVAYII